MSIELAPKQLRAAALIAEGMTQTEIAKRLEIVSITISRWKQIPEFMEEIERAKQDYCNAIRFRSKYLGDACVSALWNELKYNSSRKRTDVAFNLIKLMGAERVLASPAEPEVNANASTTANAEHST